MKIVHLMSWYMPNMGYQENYLPAEQKKLGHDVEIITSDRYTPFLSFGEKFVRDKFCWDNIIKEIEAIYLSSISVNKN